MLEAVFSVFLLLVLPVLLAAYIMRGKVMTTVWVLTTEYNDYDQHGEYFVEVFSKAPCHARLAGILAEQLYGVRTAYVAESLVAHVLAGGGRQTSESQWFYLREQELE